MQLEDLGWDEDWALALSDPALPPGLTPARVVAVHRGRVRVAGPGPLDAGLLPLAGALPEPPVTGDWIVYGAGAVRAVLPRRTVLAREDGPLVANADLALVVTSLDHDLNLRRVERLAALARAGGMEPLVVLSKGDRHPDPLAVAERVAGELHTEALVLSAHRGWGIGALGARLTAGRTAVLIGMSGVGKSTLVNLLLGEERQRTLPVRAADDRGRHATTHRELFALPSGALLVDTPGVRRPGLASADGVSGTFADVTELAAACRFADCRHETEPGCAVRGAVAPQRLASLRKLEREGMSARERRERARAGAKEVRRAIRAKERRR